MKIEVTQHFFAIWIGFGHTRTMFKKWDGLTFELACKYRWYFEYRAALLKVSNPKEKVDYTWGPYQKEELLDSPPVKNLIIARKRKITEFENKIVAYKTDYNELFPIEETYIWKELHRRADKAKNELAELQTNPKTE